MPNFTQSNVSFNRFFFFPHRDVNISASLCSQGEGMPALFMLGGSTPGQVNDCPPVAAHQNLTLCFKINSGKCPWFSLYTPQSLICSVTTHTKYMQYTGTQFWKWLTFRMHSLVLCSKGFIWYHTGINMMFSRHYSDLQTNVLFNMICSFFHI